MEPTASLEESAKRLSSRPPENSGSSLGPYESSGNALQNLRIAFNYAGNLAPCQTTRGAQSRNRCFRAAC